MALSEGPQSAVKRSRTRRPDQPASPTQCDCHPPAGARAWWRFVQATGEPPCRSATSTRTHTPSDLSLARSARLRENRSSGRWDGGTSTSANQCTAPFTPRNGGCTRRPDIAVPPDSSRGRQLTAPPLAGSRGCSRPPRIVVVRSDGVEFQSTVSPPPTSTCTRRGRSGGWPGSGAALRMSEMTRFRPSAGLPRPSTTAGPSARRNNTTRPPDMVSTTVLESPCQAVHPAAHKSGARSANRRGSVSGRPQPHIAALGLGHQLIPDSVPPIPVRRRDERVADSGVHHLRGRQGQAMPRHRHLRRLGHSRLSRHRLGPLVVEVTEGGRPPERRPKPVPVEAAGPVVEVPVLELRPASLSMPLKEPTARCEFWPPGPSAPSAIRKNFGPIRSRNRRANSTTPTP